MADTTAISYLSTIAITAELAATHKLVKYEDFLQRYAFEPIVIESHGTFSKSALDFLHKLGFRATTVSLDLRQTIVFSFNICLSLYKNLMLFVSPTLLSSIGPN